jgi:protein-disulfide isomerase
MSEGVGRRRPRAVGLVVLGVALAILATVIASLALSKGDSSPIRITGADQVQRLFGGIEQQGATLGSDTAPVTVEIFNDMQCSSCRDWQLSVIPPLVQGPVRGGDLKLVYRHFSLSEKETEFASYGAAAAGEQGYQWQYIELFFLNQDQARIHGVTDEMLEAVAAGILELDTSQWRNDLDDPAVADTLKADADLAAERRLPAQPAAVVDGPRGTRELIESPSLADIQQAIAEVG